MKTCKFQIFLNFINIYLLEFNICKIHIFLVQFKSSCHKISNISMCKFTLTSQRIDASIVEGSGIVFCIRFVDFPIYFDLENSSILNNKI